VRTGILLGLAAVALAGCTGPGGDTAAPASPTAAVTTTRAPAPTARPSGTTRRPTPRPVPPPVTTDAPCPYASATTIAETVGQRIARTTVTSTRPWVGCGYYRPNGEKAVDIAVSRLANAATAQARAVALPGRSANPVDGVGDGGAVAVSDAAALLAVSKGAALVVVRINQRVSLEAVEIAKLVVAKI
jgi:hypothetical protein